MVYLGYSYVEISFFHPQPAIYEDDFHDFSVESHLSLSELPTTAGFFRGKESGDLGFPFSLDGSHLKAACVPSRDNSTGSQTAFLYV